MPVTHTLIPVTLASNTTVHQLSAHHDVVHFNLNRQPSAAGSVESYSNAARFHGAQRASRTTHLLVHVPVETGVLQDKPVLLPFLRKVAFGVFLLPEPAFAVSPAQILAGDSSLADGGQRSGCRHKRQRRRLN